MVYSTRRFVLSLARVILFLCFSVLLALRLPRLVKTELILVLVFFVRLFYFACLVLSVFSYSWCLGRAAACDCGTPWTFLFPLFYFACLVLSVFSYSWCLGRAAACDCGTPWTFLFPFLKEFVQLGMQYIPSEAPGQEANGDNLWKCFRSSTK